jgi:hypothetical protein
MVRPSDFLCASNNSWLPYRWGSRSITRENVAGSNDLHLHFSGLMASMRLLMSCPFRHSSPYAVVMASSYLAFTYHLLPRAQEMIDSFEADALSSPATPVWMERFQRWKRWATSLFLPSFCLTVTSISSRSMTDTCVSFLQR